MKKLESSTAFIGKQINYYECVDSTNTVAKELAREGAKEGTIVVAQMQTAGKGRLGKVWDSPKDTGLWMSVILRPKIKLEALPQLTLLVGYSMCLALQEVTCQPIKIKWPNDLILNNKKICGILCETQLSGQAIGSVIAGIGVNISTMSFPEELIYASSLKKETGITYDKKVIIDTFCQKFERYYTQYTQIKNLSFIIEGYKQQCINMNQRVKIIEKQITSEEDVVEINAKGELIVTKDQHTYRAIVAGEVSVRGVYGYV